MLDSDRRHLIAYLAAAAVLVVIAVGYVSRAEGSNQAPSIALAAPAPARGRATRSRAQPRRAPAHLIWVDVAGAVRRPGLYSLPAGARIAAAITRAGGVRRHANAAAVNLAAKLADGQQIYVPPAGAALGAAAASGAGSPATSASTPGATGAPGATATPGIPSAGARISLSSATEAQLESLDGVGPALAGRIIQYREQHGGFRSIDELQEVSGIGPKRFEALKGSIAP